MYNKSPESKDSVTIEDQAKAKIDILCETPSSKTREWTGGRGSVFTITNRIDSRIDRGGKL